MAVLIDYRSSAQPPHPPKATAAAGRKMDRCQGTSPSGSTVLAMCSYRACTIVLRAPPDTQILGDEPCYHRAPGKTTWKPHKKVAAFYDKPRFAAERWREQCLLGDE